MICALFSLSACGEAKWELSASAEKKTVAPGDSFTVTVTVKNAGADYSSVVTQMRLGATPSLYCDFGGSKVYLAYEGINVTEEAKEVTIKNGESVTGKWTFYTYALDPAASLKVAAPAGSYTLKLTFLGTEKIIENFIELKAE